MKRRSLTRWVLGGALAAAGLTLSAGLAFAAHPPVTLYTYEELAMQYGLDVANKEKMPVQVDPNTLRGFPYSPKQTCGGCHEYTQISDHAFHAALGMHEWQDTADGEFKIDDPNVIKPWTQSGAMWGKW